MKTPRMPWSHHVHAMLGIPEKLPANFELAPEKTVNLAAADTGEADRYIRFQVLTAADADLLSINAGNEKPGRGRPRVFAECDHCGSWVSAGRFNQHYNSHKL